jgi:hypothetical protein
MAHVYDENGKGYFHLSPAQAKKENLFFSVTEMQKIIAKPALEYWKIAQHLKTAHNHPPHAGEDEAAFIKRIKSLTWRNSGGAAELGTKVHEALESVLKYEMNGGEDEEAG